MFKNRKKKSAQSVLLKGNPRRPKDQKFKFKKSPKTKRRGWHGFVAATKLWPMAMVRELRRIHWLSKGKLFRLFLITMIFLLFFVVIFAAFNQLWLVILRSIHVL